MPEESEAVGMGQARKSLWIETVFNRGFSIVRFLVRLVRACGSKKITTGDRILERWVRLVRACGLRFY